MRGITSITRCCIPIHISDSGRTNFCLRITSLICSSMKTIWCPCSTCILCCGVCTKQINNIMFTDIKMTNCFFNIKFVSECSIQTIGINCENISTFIDCYKFGSYTFIFISLDISFAWVKSCRKFTFKMDRLVSSGNTYR